MESGFKFTTVLRSIKKAPYTLDKVCDGEIAWKRGYSVSSIGTLDAVPIFLTVYKFSNTASDLYKYNIHSLRQFKGVLIDNSDCIIIVQKTASGELTDISFAAIELSGIKNSIESKTLEILQRTGRDYDELAPKKVEPVRDVVNPELPAVEIGVQVAADEPEDSDSDSDQEPPRYNNRRDYDSASDESC